MHWSRGITALNYFSLCCLLVEILIGLVFNIRSLWNINWLRSCDLIAESLCILVPSDSRPRRHLASTVRHHRPVCLWWCAIFGVWNRNHRRHLVITGMLRRLTVQGQEVKQPRHQHTMLDHPHVGRIQRSLNSADGGRIFYLGGL